MISRFKIFFFPVATKPLRKLVHKSRVYLFFSCFFLLAAQSPLPREYQIKAVFLYNFAQFVSWPATSFPTTGTPLVIGVIGEDPFGSYLDQTVSHEEINGHTLEVRRFNQIQDIENCHILFVNVSSADKIDSVFATVKSRRILTVGESENFINQGGMIRFTIENGRIRMQINPEEVRSEGLEISSKLLRVADIVSVNR